VDASDPIRVGLTARKRPTMPLSVCRPACSVAARSSPAAADLARTPSPGARAAGVDEQDAAGGVGAGAHTVAPRSREQVQGVSCDGAQRCAGLVGRRPGQSRSPVCKPGIQRRQCGSGRYCSPVLSSDRASGHDCLCGAIDSATELPGVVHLIVGNGEPAVSEAGLDDPTVQIARCAQSFVPDTRPPRKRNGGSIRSTGFARGTRSIVSRRWSTRRGPSTARPCPVRVTAITCNAILDRAYRR
jgi:hypothetical protein